MKIENFQKKTENSENFSFHFFMKIENFQKKTWKFWKF